MSETRGNTAGGVLLGALIAGAASIVGQMLATDSSEQSQRVLFNQQITVADRAELRTVIDEAATELQGAYVLAERVKRRWRTTDAPITGQLARRARASSGRLNRSLARLQLRLGVRSDPTAAFFTAAADAAEVWSGAAGRPGKRAKARIARRLERFPVHRLQFVRLARDLLDAPVLPITAPEK